MAARGGIAQLGERDAGSVEARGSSPLTSTFEAPPIAGSFFWLVCVGGVNRDANEKPRKMRH